MPQIETFGGGEAVHTLVDTQQVSYAIMVNIEMRSEDRELTVPRPMYEYPLLKRLYASRGGSARIDPLWIVRKNGEDAAPRHVSLTREMLRTESARLMKEFRIPSQQGGWHSFYETVYGKGNAGFYEAVTKIVRGYQTLVKLSRQANRQITVEEWENLAKSIEPAQAEIDTIESITLDAPTPAVEGMVSVDDIADPIADIQAYLGEKGWSPDVALQVASQHASGTVNERSLNTISEVSQKPNEIRRLYGDYKAAIAKPE